MPLNLKVKHDDIINLVNSLGYDTDDGGMCNGITMMAVQAFTVGRVKEFNARLKFLKRHNISRRLKRYQRKVTKASQSGKLPQLVSRNQKLIDVVAFCDGVNLYQDPDNNDSLFGRCVTQSNRDSIANLVDSSELKALGGLEKINSWLGVYDDNELKQYVSELNRIAKKVRCSFTLIMYSSDHTMAMCYDAPSEKWFVINANALPIQQLKLRKIPEWIQKGFDEPTKTIMFETSVYVAGNQLKRIAQFNERVKSSRSMTELHRITEKRAKYSDYNDTSLVHLAAEHGHAALIDELHQVGADLNALDNDARTPAWLAAQFGHVAVIEALIWAGAKLNLSHKYGATPAFNATIYEHVNILRLLARAGIDLSQKTPRGYLLEIAKERNVTESIRFLENYKRWKAREGVNGLSNSMSRSRSSMFYHQEKKSQKRNFDQVSDGKRRRVG